MHKVQIYINKHEKPLKYRINGGGGVVPRLVGLYPHINGHLVGSAMDVSEQNPSWQYHIIAA